jgi:hypothetical protein
VTSQSKPDARPAFTLSAPAPSLLVRIDTGLIQGVSMLSVHATAKLRLCSALLPIAAVLLFVTGLSTPRAARADGVTTCTNSSAVNTAVTNCLSNLVYQPLPLSSTTLVLVCPQGTAGLQDQSQCPGNIWKPLSSISDPNTLVGYCAQQQLTPYTACDYPNGKEGYKLYSAVFGTTGTPAPPTGSVTGSAQISWSAPAVDTQGNPITVTGYTIRYGTTDFSQSVSVSASTRTYAFQNLAPGTWQFEIVATDSAGNSQPSNPVTLTISGSQTCGAAPATATQTVACPAGTTGTWTQTHGWTAAAYPTCWTANAWTPTSPPAGSCQTAATTWKTQTSETVNEPVLDSTGTTLVLGTAQGKIAGAKACGNQVFVSGSNSYRTVSESDVTLSSPTYRGRGHVAICTQQ